LPDHLKSMAALRLELAGEYIDDSVRLKDEIRPGRLIIVDLRDEFIEKTKLSALRRGFSRSSRTRSFSTRKVLNAF